MDRDEEMPDVDSRRDEPVADRRSERGDRDDRSGRDDRDRESHRDRDRESHRGSERRREHHRHRSPSRSRSRSPGGHRSSRHRSHRDDHRSRSRSRDRRRRDDSRDRYRRDDSRDRYRRRNYSRSRDRRPHYRDRSPPPRSVGGPMNASPEEAEAHAKVSVKENRVYVGNLAYPTTYKDLEKFCQQAGEVVFSEIFVTPAGQSKGCGIVEFASRDDAMRAIKDLSERKLLGRACFIREDREQSARFGAAPIPGRIGQAMGEGPYGGRGGFRGGARGGFGGAPPRAGTVDPDFRQLFIENLPMQATWQDMKDLFREAGAVIRADVNFFPDGTPKGTGIVAYETHEDAENAIQLFNGSAWHEAVLVVRPDRFPQTSARGRGGGFGGRGGFAPRGGFMPRGGFGGGFGGPMNGQMGGMMGEQGGRNFTNDLYADYNGPDGSGNGMMMDPSMGMMGGVMPMAAAMPQAEPSAQIKVRNLPWSTANEDLVELFETTGSVVLAEILFEGQRSTGSGVVQFKEVSEAEEACIKFTGYVYGGRPLDVRYNEAWHEFSETAAAGGTVPPPEAPAEIPAETGQA